MQLDLSIEPILWILVIIVSACIGWLGSSLWYGRRLRRVHKEEWAKAKEWHIQQAKDKDARDAFPAQVSRSESIQAFFKAHPPIH